LLNVMIIAAVWVGGELLNLEPYAHARFVALAVLVAGVLQLALQLAWLRATRFRVVPNVDVAWRRLSAASSTLMMPMMVGMSALQLNTFIDSMIAFFLGVRWSRAPPSWAMHST
jgi:peptidoglycan biosynthesis protein MviN/MurJ (putative lipid II flippase)